MDPTLSNKYFYTFTLRSEPLDEILRIMARIQPMKYTFNEENELTISFADTKQKVKWNSNKIKNLCQTNKWEMHII